MHIKSDEGTEEIRIIKLMEMMSVSSRQEEAYNKFR